MLPDISADDMRSRIQDALMDEFWAGANRDQADDASRLAAQNIWVADVFPVSMTVVYYGQDEAKYKRGFSFDQSGAVHLAPAPVEVQRTTTYEPVGPSFGLTRFSQTSAAVVRSGKVFEVGDYPDKSFSLNDAEAQAAVDLFNPVDVDHEHLPVKGFLGNTIGTVQRLWKEGKELFADVSVPKWLDTLMGEDPLKVSLTWDRDTKTVAGCALTTSPRISDAQLGAAFALFAGRRHSTGDQADIQAIHDLTVKQGATCANEEDPQGKANMNTATKDKLLAHLKQNPNALAGASFTLEQLETDLGGSGGGVSPDVQARLDQLERNNAEMAANTTRIHEAALRQAAATFAEDLIVTQKKALPAQKDDLVEVYVLAAKADGTGSAATFSDTGSVVEGANVKRVRDLYAKAKPLALFNEHIPGAAPAGEGDRKAQAESILAGAVEQYNGGRN